LDVQRIVTSRFSSRILKTPVVDTTTLAAQIAKKDGALPAVLDPSKDDFPDQLKDKIEKEKQAKGLTVPSATAKGSSSKNSGEKASLSGSVLTSKFGIMKRKQKERKDSKEKDEENGPEEKGDEVATTTLMDAEDLSSAGSPASVQEVVLPPLIEKPFVAPPRRIDLLPDTVPGEEPLLEPVFPDKNDGSACPG
jgi:hypothetical protein